MATTSRQKWEKYLERAERGYRGIDLSKLENGDRVKGNLWGEIDGEEYIVDVSVDGWVELRTIREVSKQIGQRSCWVMDAMGNVNEFLTDLKY